MNVAVISDIHGNYEALKSCVEYCDKRRVSTYIFLGDYISDFAKPQRVMQFLYELQRERQCFFIKGNKEDYYLNSDIFDRIDGEHYPSSTGYLSYTYENLTKKDFDFFRSLDITDRIEIEGFEPLTVCHGSPKKSNEKLYFGGDNTHEYLEKLDTRILLCGHTHLQMREEYKGKVLINPGSLGVPLNSGGKLQFVILHDENGSWKDEFVALNYDSEAELKELFAEGLDKRAPYWTKITMHNLRAGLIHRSQGNILGRAIEICRDRYDACDWIAIPEDCWKEAYEQFFGKEDLQSFLASFSPEEYDFPIRLSETDIYESPWMSIHSDRVQMSDGFIIEKYHRVTVPNDSVAVVIMNEKEEILLIRSKRYTTGRMEWEIPAGGINPLECNEAAARRECLEETGCEIKDLSYLCSMNPCNGITDLTIHYYCAKVDSESQIEDTNEVLEKRWVSKKDALLMIQNNQTKSEISAFAIMFAIQFGTD